MVQPRVAITHATSLLAEAILEKLPELGLAPDSIVLLADESLVGSKLAYSQTYLTVKDQADFDYSECSLVLMLEYEQQIVQKMTNLDTVLLSHSSQLDGDSVFAANKDSQLDISYTQRVIKLVDAEQACLLGILPALHQRFTITRINTVLMRSAEARGKAGVEELAGQTIALLNSKEVKPRLYPLQIAFNLLPEASNTGFNRELARLIGSDSIECVHQIVDVPVFHGFSAAIQLSFASDVSLEASQSVLKAIDNVHVKSSAVSQISDCNQSFNCIVSRLEAAGNQSSSIQFWMTVDPLRYGLSNNYVNVSDILLKSFL